jgi:hypothetical protein
MAPVNFGNLAAQLCEGSLVPYNGPQRKKRQTKQEKAKEERTESCHWVSLFMTCHSKLPQTLNPKP